MIAVFTVWDNDFTHDIKEIVKLVSEDFCIRHSLGNLVVSEDERKLLAYAVAHYTCVVTAISHKSMCRDFDHRLEYVTKNFKVILTNDEVESSVWGSDKVCLLLETGYIWIV